jgi:predicted tellurium resistance membrane protein TerC
MRLCGSYILATKPFLHDSVKCKNNSKISHSSSTSSPLGSALRSAVAAIRNKSRSYILKVEDYVDRSIHHPVEAVMANEPWLLFSVCFSAITSVSLYLSTKSTATNEIYFDKACLILWIGCSLCLFLSVAYTNSLEMGTVWMSTYLTEMILSLENMLAYHAVFSLHRVPSPDRPKGLFWGIGLAMFIRFVLLAVGGALVTGSSIARMVIGSILTIVGLLWIFGLIDSTQQRKAKAFQIASTVCTSTEKVVPASWWHYFTPKEAGNESLPVSALQPGQSKWAIGVPIFVSILAIELCDSFLTVWNTLAVVAQTSSLFITYSSTAFALMTVRSLYLVLVASRPAIEPRLLHTTSAGGIVALAIGCNLIISYAVLDGPPSNILSASIGVIGLGLLGSNLIAWWTAATNRI